MTKSLFATLAVMVLAASSISAQNGPQLRVNLPFDFAAGRNALPAGEYYVRISNAPDSIWFQKADGKRSVVVVTHRSQGHGRIDVASLVFHVYGDRYFLAQVYPTGKGIGEELPQSREEREQITARHASKTVTVAASLR